jgi:predicted nucleotidyltransferase
MAQADGSEISVRRRVLPLRGDNITSDVDVAVVQLMMEDGVEIIALEKEAFDVAFGGKERLHEEMARETAHYIEVNFLSIAV